MKNKKLKVFIIAVLILQILAPAGLLTHHYTLHDTAKKESPEFKFRLDGLSIYDIYDSGEGDEKIVFDVRDLFEFYHQDIAVTVGDDGYAHMELAEDKSMNKHWFTFEYCYNRSYESSDNYKYEDGIDIAELHQKVNKIYGLDVEKPEGFYITAKVYKGIFIPISIYIENEKVITFLNDK